MNPDTTTDIWNEQWVEALLTDWRERVNARRIERELAVISGKRGNVRGLATG